MKPSPSVIASNRAGSTGAGSAGATFAGAAGAARGSRSCCGSGHLLLRRCAAGAAGASCLCHLLSHPHFINIATGAAKSTEFDTARTCAGSHPSVGLRCSFCIGIGHGEASQSSDVTSKPRQKHLNYLKFICKTRSKERLL